MINQKQLSELYRQMTGSTVHQEKADPVVQDRWQRSKITEYAFKHEGKVS
jgi:hypothetical protein